MSQIQAVANDNGVGAATVVVTIAPSTAGTTLMCFVSIHSGTAATVIADNLSQGWTYQAISGTTNLSLFYKTGSASGVTSVTVTCPGSSSAMAYVVERDDVPGFDQAAASVYIGVAGPWTGSTTGTLAQANEILYCFGYSGDSTTVFNGIGSGNGWSAATGTGITGPNGTRSDANGDSSQLQQQIVTSTAAVTGAGSITSSATVAVVAFKYTPSGGAVYAPMYYARKQFYPV